MNGRVTASMPAFTTIVDLVFEAGCPHVDDARTLLRQALLDAGLPALWREWNRDAADTPLSLRGLGSPTILVNGADVIASEPAPEIARANGCRLYQHGSELRGVPPVDAIVRALSASARA
jgi:hypothetical protein